jgi:gas vesicle protein
MGKISGFLAGLMSGAIVGAVAALLLAPMSGQELQTQTRDQFDHLIDDARHAAETKRVQLEAQLEALKAPKPAEKQTSA